jgi:hypothetical protein
MKKFLLFFVLFLPALLIAQLPDGPAVIEKFQDVYLAVTGVAYFILVALLKNATWLPAWLNTKILAAIIASIVAIVAVFMAGLPALSVSAIIGLVGTLYNFVKGWIDAGNGQKKKVTATPEQTSAKAAKFGK